MATTEEIQTVRARYTAAGNYRSGAWESMNAAARIIAVAVMSSNGPTDEEIADYRSRVEDYEAAAERETRLWEVLETMRRE